MPQRPCLWGLGDHRAWGNHGTSVPCSLETSVAQMTDLVGSVVPASSSRQRTSPPGPRQGKPTWALALRRLRLITLLPRRWMVTSRRVADSPLPGAFAEKLLQTPALPWSLRGCVESSRSLLWWGALGGRSSHLHFAYWMPPGIL